MRIPEVTSKDFVQSLGRGLHILQTIATEGGTHTLTSVAAHTNLSRGTARRLLATLSELGFLEHQGREYRLTSQVLDLGYGYLSSLGLPALVSEHISKLAAEVGEAVSVTVRENREIVYVARANPARVMTVSLGVGARLPIWNTSMGRVHLSALDDDGAKEVLEGIAPLSPYTSLTVVNVDDLVERVRQARTNGWCLVDQELEWGLRSLAVPLRQRGAIVAALNVATAQVGENPRQTTQRLLPSLQRAQERIEWALDRAPDLRPSFSSDVKGKEGNIQP
jgi:IclR family pca regulon transcriptional regulator